MRLPAVQVQRGVARPRLVRILVWLGGLVGGLLSDPLPGRLSRPGEGIWRGCSIVVLLLVDGDVEMLHAEAERVGLHR